MKGVPGTGLSPPEAIEYPSSDGEPMAESGPHAKALTDLFVMLREKYRGKMAYVAADMFLYFKEGDPSACRAPDLMVVKGVPSEPERASFFTWVENAVPSVVIELTSPKTVNEDTGAKKDIYQQLRVREYFLFDPLGDCLPRPLMGFRLLSVAENGNGNGDLAAVEVRYEYEELTPAADGSMTSSELGLRLLPQGENLLLFDLVSGEQLIPPADAYERMEEYRDEVDRQRQRAEAAEKRAEEAEKELEEMQAALAKAKQQADQEIERLKKALARLQGQSPQPGQGPAGEGTS